jgi:hypothetical protein
MLEIRHPRNRLLVVGHCLADRHEASRALRIAAQAHRTFADPAIGRFERLLAFGCLLARASIPIDTGRVRFGPDGHTLWL